MRIYLLLLVLLSACSSPHADKYQTAETESDVINLFNEHEYARAVWLIENRHGKDPQDAKISFLLGQAYLGKSGIEPLAFTAKVASPQEKELPFFSSCSTAQITSFRETEIKCLLKRVYASAPGADQKDFKRARELFRQAYPNPSSSPAWVNTVIGLVEMISFVNRTGDLYLYAKGVEAKGKSLNFNELDIPWLRHQGDQAILEADQALQRAQYSSEKVARLLGAAKESEWFERGKNGVEFAKATGLPGLIDFIQENISPSDDIRYGGLLEKLRDLLAAQEKSTKK